MLNDSDRIRINSFLKRFGLTVVEIEVYLEVLKLGPSSIQELSRSLQRNRISVYYSVHQLIEKGLLYEMRNGKRRLVTTASPDVFQKIFDKKHAELHAMELEIGYISELINTIPVVRNHVTVVKQYEDTLGFKKMLEESLHAKKEIMVFTSTPFYLSMLGEDYFEKYFLRKAELGIITRMIYPPGDFASKLHAKRDSYKIDLRILPQNQKSESGFYLWDNTLAIDSLKEGKKSCTIIENKDIAHFFRDNVFNPFWEMARPIE